MRRGLGFESRVRRTSLSVGLLAIAIAVVTIASASASTAASGRAAASFSVAVHVSPGTAPSPYTTNAAASVALGEPDLVSTANACAVTAFAECNPAYAAFDAYGNLWVVDRGSNRVLEYTPPFTTNMSASLVIGQSTFTTDDSATTAAGLNYPSGLAFDAAGDLWVADGNNNRVLEYLPPFHNGMKASLVIGERSFNSSSENATNASNLEFPEELAFSASGDLFVSVYDQNRVLEYVPPFHNGQAASVALGQKNFTTDAAVLSANGLNEPVGLVFTAAGDLWVADSLNNRVVEYAPPFVTNESATTVIGQKTFVAGEGGTGAANLTSPFGLGLDPQGGLWVGDWENDRVLMFPAPQTSGESATVVLGQTGFGMNAGGTSARKLIEPRNIVFDAAGDVWIPDEGNSRVLEFVPPHYGVVFTESGLPGGTSWSVAVGSSAGTSTSTVLQVPVVNGTYTYYAQASNGYVASPSSSSVTVNGTGTTIALSFSAQSTLGGALLWIVVAAILGVIAVVEAVLLVRRRPKGSRPPPTPVAPAPTPPPGAGGTSSGGPGLPPPTG